MRRASPRFRSLTLLYFGVLLFLLALLAANRVALASLPPKFDAANPHPRGSLYHVTHKDTAHTLDTPTATPTSCTQGWTITSSPNVGTGTNELNGVATVSANDIWAVGRYRRSGAYQTLTEHWDGSSWSVVTSTNVFTDNNTLYSVAAVAATDVWAVGSYRNASSNYQTLIEHWNGNQWSVVPGPNVGSSNNDLYWVAVVSSNDVWAVGHSRNANSIYETLTEHWNGTQWSVVPSPNVESSNNELDSVAAVATNDVWAVGHWRNASNIYQTLTEHWDGTAWSMVPSPSIGSGNNDLYGITAVSASDVWAVGHYRPGTTIYQTLIEHWDGSSWNVVPSSNAGSDNNNLNEIAAISGNDVWAVSHYLSGGIYQTLAEHWDGSTWDVVPSSNGGSGNNDLNAVAAISANDIWAVGYYTSTGVSSQTLIERYHPCVTPNATATPTNTPAGTSTLGATLTATGTPTVCAITFTDVAPTEYFYRAVRYLYCQGAISGYPGNTFRPYDSITRGQLCRTIVLAKGWTTNTAGGPHFEDVPVSNSYYPFIETAYNRSIVAGYDDHTFGWSNNVSRAQLCKIVALAQGWTIATNGGPHFRDVSIEHPFYRYIETAFSHLVISGYDDHTFLPGDNAARGQICKVVYSAIIQP